MITEIAYCRLCKSKNIETVFDFGSVPLANDLVAIGDERKSLESPLEVVRCLGCFGVQLKHDVDPNILFKNYLYSTPPNLDNHFKEYAKTVSSYLKLKKGNAVVEIGGNNGLLCQHFKNLGFYPVNVDPGLKVAQLSLERGIKTHHGFFNKETAKRIKGADTGLVKCIVANNVLAHCSLDIIMDGVVELLDEDGVLVMENAYLPKTIDNKDLGQFYCEHLHYHLLTPLKTYFAKYDLNLFKVEFNNVQMGSFRAYIGKKRPDETSISNAIAYEKLFIDDIGYYNKFWKSINNLTRKLYTLVEDLPDISIYGCPAKLVLLLKLINSTKFKYAAEDSALKVGKKVPGSNIEIQTSGYFKNNPTQYCLIGAYNFCQDIIKKNPQYKGIWLDPISLQLY